MRTMRAFVVVMLACLSLMVQAQPADALPQDSLRAFDQFFMEVADFIEESEYFQCVVSIDMFHKV